MDLRKILALTLFRALLALAVLACAPLHAQETSNEVPEWRIRFDNLAASDQQQFIEHFVEASRLFGQKRIFESLNSITKAEGIYKEYPSLLNLKGACYVEFRDFATARKCFLAADALSPDNPDILFNLAEIAFVSHEWEECERRLNDLLPLTNKKNMQMLRLIEFKLLLAKSKLNKTEEVKALAAKYDFNDDSPFHYYAEAAMAYEANDTSKAEGWIRTARRVFQKDELLAPWQDTMIEFGYISSFYGGDLEDPSVPSAPPQP